MTDVKNIINLMSSPTEKDIGLVEKAYIFAEKAHYGQKRFSGDDYFLHLFETAKNLASYGMNAQAVAAGLLHDSIEDGVATEEEIREKFSDEILFLVKGVTKLGGFKYKGVKRHAESLRRLFLAMSEDIRVLIIKFADRLHNMQTLQYVPHEKQERKGGWFGSHAGCKHSSGPPPCIWRFRNVRTLCARRGYGCIRER